MWKNYLVIATRNFWRHKGYYSLNILGLAIGMACAILIVTYVLYELSYDRDFERSDRTYRLAVDAVIGNTEIHQTGTPAPMAQALYDEFPEIEYVSRATAPFRTFVSHGDKTFAEPLLVTVDSTFFRIFDIPFIRGNRDKCLNDPFEVVITESIAEKYFGDQDPVNQVLEIEDDYTGDNAFKVTAVIEDIPENSHLNCNIFTSLTSFDGYYNNTGWFNNNFMTYFSIYPSVDIQSVKDRFPGFKKKYLFANSDYDEWTAKGNKWEFYFQPVTDIHLTSDLSGEFEANGNRSYVYIFSIVAVFILVLAAVNFMNLTTAKSANRAREVGIRKVAGGTRWNLIRQFLGESVIISFVALVLAVVMVEILQPHYNRLVGQDLDPRYFTDFRFLLALIGLALFMGLLSGSYPAFYLSSFQPVSVLKGTMHGRSGKKWLRNALVTFQFFISVVLIIGTIVVYRQLDHLRNKDLGFNKEQVLVIHNPSLLGKSGDAFKNEILRAPFIESAAFSTRVPGQRLNNIGFGAEEVGESFTLNIIVAEEGFDKVMGLELTQGRFFDRRFGTDTAGIVINEAAQKLLGWEDATGKGIHDHNQPRNHFEVLGVVRDFHYESMHMKVRPMAILHMEGMFSWSPGYLSVRFRGEDTEKVVRHVEDTWDRFTAGLPAEYSFLDHLYDEMYRNEAHMKQLFIVFSLLAVIIASLGLLGLASFLAEQKTKEIGIRKTYGASASNIFAGMSKEFLKWVLIANLIAWPVAWWVMDRWLQDFANRIDIRWWYFIAATLLSLIITLLTVSWQVARAASSNPVDALRYE